MFKQKMHTIRQQIIMNEKWKRKKNEKITKIENRKKLGINKRINKINLQLVCLCWEK